MKLSIRFQIPSKITIEFFPASVGTQFRPLKTFTHSCEGISGRKKSPRTGARTKSAIKKFRESAGVSNRPSESYAHPREQQIYGRNRIPLRASTFLTIEMVLKCVRGQKKPSENTTKGRNARNKPPGNSTHPCYWLFKSTDSPLTHLQRASGGQYEHVPSTQSCTNWVFCCVNPVPTHVFWPVLA